MEHRSQWWDDIIIIIIGPNNNNNNNNKAFISGTYMAHKIYIQ